MTGPTSDQAAEFERETGPLRREILAHCYRMMGSAADAEDLVQETYLRAWRGWADFDRRASTRTWLHRIATNACLNALAAASRRVLPSGLGAPAGDPTAPLNERDDVAWLEPLPDAMLWTSARPTPEERLLARENVTLAWAAALQSLTPQQRAVLLLRDVLGLSAAETAETLDTSVASVNSTLQRGRAAVGDGLDEHDAEVPGRPRTGRSPPSSTPSSGTTSTRSWPPCRPGRAGRCRPSTAGTPAPGSSRYSPGRTARRAPPGTCASSPLAPTVARPSACTCARAGATRRSSSRC